MKKMFSLFIMMLLLSPVLSFAKTFYEIDDNGYPVIVDIRPISKIEAFIRQMFVVQGIATPNPVQPGQRMRADFYVTVECPSGCTGDYFTYDWEYGHGEIRVGDVCYTTQMITVTHHIPTTTPDGNYEMIGYVHGPLDCRASSTDTVQFTVGSEIECDEGCESWGRCVRGIRTRTCYELVGNRCVGNIETDQCQVTTTTITTTTIPEDCTCVGPCQEGETLECNPVDGLCCTKDKPPLDMKTIGIIIAVLGGLLILYGVYGNGKKR